MNTYLILFRGINVGGKNPLPMKRLVTLLTNSGLSDVQTYIQSGNVVLKSEERPGAELASVIESEFGFSPDILVLSKSEFAAAIEKNPFSRTSGKESHMYFCSGKPNPDNEKISKYKSDTEDLLIDGNVAYLHAPDGIGRSKLVANIEACLRVSATGRNLNTARKLEEMISDA